MQKKIREIYQIAKTTQKPLLMSNAISSLYPTIIDSEGQTSTVNFITDYLSNYSIYDSYVKFQYGQRVYDNEDMTVNNIYNPWLEEANSIVAMHIESWARIYYALSLQYNPLWNVDGTEKETYSEVETTSNYGIDKTTAAFGLDKTTMQNGSITTEGKSYEVTYEDAAEHQIGRGVNTTNAITNTNTRDAHTDSSTRDAREDSNVVGEHTITKTRGGNIGVTKTTELLADQWKLYQNNFFKMVAETIVKESGADYENW